jgi:hypothetical protein
MKNFKLFLKTISVNDIHLQCHFKKEIYLNHSNKSSYIFYRDYETQHFNDFISSLDSNKLYSVIPMISIKACLNRPYIVLSQSILLSKYSNYHMLNYYIHNKHMEVMDEFGMKNIDNPVLTLKYKNILIDLNQLNRRFPSI